MAEFPRRARQRAAVPTRVKALATPAAKRTASQNPKAAGRVIRGGGRHHHREAGTQQELRAGGDPPGRQGAHQITEIIGAGSQPPWARDRPESTCISGRSGVKAKRPMPMATARATRPARARARRGGWRARHAPL